jgi:hypothetical protein
MDSVVELAESIVSFNQARTLTFDGAAKESLISASRDAVGSYVGSELPPLQRTVAVGC